MQGDPSSRRENTWLLLEEIWIKQKKDNVFTYLDLAAIKFSVMLFNDTPQKVTVSNVKDGRSLVISCPE